MNLPIGNIVDGRTVKMVIVEVGKGILVDTDIVVGSGVYGIARLSKIENNRK